MSKLEVISFNKQIFHAVSLSGGKDSTAMLLLMIERGLPINTVLWADTGMEFPEMYDHIRKVDDYLYRERGICEFAEMQERNGNTYVPSAPKISAEIGTYEIYQIPATADVDYYFRSYAAAKGKLQSADYRRSYAGMYAKENSLENLWAKHNRDSRPFAHRMRSMSVSDIVVLTQGGKKTAYYADTIGFKEIPEFLAQQRVQKKHKERGEAR